MELSTEGLVYTTNKKDIEEYSLGNKEVRVEIGNYNLMLQGHLTEEEERYLKESKAYDEEKSFRLARSIMKKIEKHELIILKGEGK